MDFLWKILENHHFEWVNHGKSTLMGLKSNASSPSSNAEMA
jgi:hypothetical protein